MARFLYGKVVVRAIIVEADDEKLALEILKQTNSGQNKVVCEHELTWGETPDRDVMHERDGVLAEFLRIMQQEIPLGSAKTIIVKPWKDASSETLAGN